MKANENIIEKAFARLESDKHNRMIEGLRGLLDDAILFIFEQHEVDGRTKHKETGDTYGWAIGYNGEIIDLKITNEGVNPSDHFSVQDELNEMIGSTKGYTGIIMAGMDPAHWFVMPYEVEYQELAKDMIAAEFERFFRK